jgi:hypothetical protein
MRKEALERCQSRVFRGMFNTSLTTTNRSSIKAICSSMVTSSMEFTIAFLVNCLIHLNLIKMFYKTSLQKTQILVLAIAQEELLAGLRSL